MIRALRKPRVADLPIPREEQRGTQDAVEDRILLDGHRGLVRCIGQHERDSMRAGCVSGIEVVETVGKTA